MSGRRSETRGLELLRGSSRPSAPSAASARHPLSSLTHTPSFPFLCLSSLPHDHHPYGPDDETPESWPGSAPFPSPAVPTTHHLRPFPLPSLSLLPPSLDARISSFLPHPLPWSSPPPSPLLLRLAPFLPPTAPCPPPSPRPPKPPPLHPRLGPQRSRRTLTRTARAPRARSASTSVSPACTPAKDRRHLAFGSLPCCLPLLLRALRLLLWLVCVCV